MYEVSCINGTSETKRFLRQLQREKQISFICIHGIHAEHQHQQKECPSAEDWTRLDSRKATQRGNS